MFIFSKLQSLNSFFGESPIRVQVKNNGSKNSVPIWTSSENIISPAMPDTNSPELEKIRSKQNTTIQM